MKCKTNKAARRLKKGKNLHKGKVAKQERNSVGRGIGAYSLDSVITPRVKKDQSVIINEMKFENCNVVFGGNISVSAITNEVQKDKDEGFLKHLKKVGWTAISLAATGLIKYLMGIVL